MNISVVNTYLNMTIFFYMKVGSSGYISDKWFLENENVNDKFAEEDFGICMSAVSPKTLKEFLEFLECVLEDEDSAYHESPWLEEDYQKLKDALDNKNYKYFFS